MSYKQNPHNVPIEKIVWLKGTPSWQNPLKVSLGFSGLLASEDGRPFVMIAELCAPDKCTYHCHPDNFYPMDTVAKRIALGESITDQP